MGLTVRHTSLLIHGREIELGVDPNIDRFGQFEVSLLVDGKAADEVVPAENAGDYTDPGSKWNVEADMLDEQATDEISDSIEECPSPAYVTARDEECNEQ